MTRRNYYKSPKTGDWVLIILTVIAFALLIVVWRWST